MLFEIFESVRKASMMSNNKSQPKQTMMSKLPLGFQNHQQNEESTSPFKFDKCFSQNAQDFIKDENILNTTQNTPATTSETPVFDNADAVADVNEQGNAKMSSCGSNNDISPRSSTNKFKC